MRQFAPLDLVIIVVNCKQQCICCYLHSDVSEELKQSKGCKCPDDNWNV